MSQELPEPDLSLMHKIQHADGKFVNVHVQNFKKEEKDLYYIGTHHGSNFENTSHETILQAIHKYKPQFVILEGIETNKGVSPAIGNNPNLSPQAQAALYLQSEETLTLRCYYRKNIFHLSVVSRQQN
jgi:predicted AlkP superfamily pyrophosphatase or phosphodiesterase